MANKPIDAKLLAGLTFRTTKEEKDEAGNVTRNIPVVRELTPADVLDWKDNGPTVTIVTADGKKLTVDKKPTKGDDQK